MSSLACIIEFLPYAIHVQSMIDIESNKVYTTSARISIQQVNLSINTSVLRHKTINDREYIFVKPFEADKWLQQGIISLWSL